jgi:hypothetical protein
MEDLPTQQKKAEASKTIALGRGGGGGGVISTESTHNPMQSSKMGFSYFLPPKTKHTTSQLSLTYSIIIGLFFARLFLLLSSHTPLCFSLHGINNLCIDQQDPQSIYIYIYIYNPKP